jgi:hypothetical protein
MSRVALLTTRVATEPVNPFETQRPQQ